MVATLKIEGLCRQFSRNVWGLHPTDLTVEEHEFVVLLGPSGCGKSTTIRLIAGLEEATTGSIRIDDIDVTYLPPRSRNVSMVFQNYAVWPHMTVQENIAFPLQLKKLGGAEIEASVRDTAGMTGITELLGRYPRQLSGGQQQRVALARALAVHPRVFLMDEPLSNLDAKLRASMRTEMKAIHQKTRATTVFVTHDQSEAMSMADRIVVMKEGRITQIGTPEQVYRYPANLFVAGFIGTPPTNLLKAELLSENDCLTLQHKAFSLDLQDTRTSATAKEVWLGIRPEDISCCSESKADTVGTVCVVEPQGSHQIVAVTIGPDTVKVIADAKTAFNPGERIGLAFDPSALHLFDCETTERLEVKCGS